ncbi:glycosyltransferase family 2 protein [Patescibacteria group bacterium]
MAEDLEIEAIVPAYNEGSTVATVVQVIATHPHIKKVVVVDDGSSDKTAQNIRDMIVQDSLQDKVKLIEQKNSGKTKAIEVGFGATISPLILMLDSDLIGLTHEHITELINPVLEGKVVMTIGLFKSGRFITDLAHRTNPNLSGQRVMKRECLEAVDWQKTKNFGLESHLTDLIKTKKWYIQWINLKGMTHRMKTEKRGFWHGWISRFQMYKQIFINDISRQTGWSTWFRKKKN